MSKKLPDLGGFTGSENWYQHQLARNLVYTDGIQFLAEEVGAYWLIDLVASHLPGIRRAAPDETFLLWRLRRVGDGCVVSAHSDSGQPSIIEQAIEYTDFPEDFEFYVVNDSARWCMMLKSEY